MRIFAHHKEPYNWWLFCEKWPTTKGILSLPPCSKLTLKNLWGVDSALLSRLSCRSFFAKQPLIIGLFCRKWRPTLENLWCADSLPVWAANQYFFSVISLLNEPYMTNAEQPFINNLWRVVLLPVCMSCTPTILSSHLATRGWLRSVGSIKL